MKQRQWGSFTYEGWKDNFKSLNDAFCSKVERMERKQRHWAN